MKVLFLDIDGVLNSDNWFAYRLYCIRNGMVDRIKNFVDTTDEQTEYLLYNIDDRAVANLNRIIEETGCEVVLSSSWRSKSEQNNIYTNYILKLKGFKYDFYGITPHLLKKDYGTERGEEIQMWLDKELEKNEIESYVILDDDSDMLAEQMDNFVHINSLYGLSDIDVTKSINILNE